MSHADLTKEEISWLYGLEPMSKREQPVGKLCYCLRPNNLLDCFYPTCGGSKENDLRKTQKLSCIKAATLVMRQVLGNLLQKRTAKEKEGDN